MKSKQKRMKSIKEKQNSCNRKIKKKLKLNLEYVNRAKDDETENMCVK